MLTTTSLRANIWPFLFILLVYCAPAWGQTCNAPYALGTSNLGTSTVQLYWYYATAPVANSPFEVQIRVSGATSWSTISNIPNPTANTYTYYTVSNLTPGTSYQWQVRSACSPFSTSATFSTAACVPPNSLNVESLPTSAQLRWFSHAPVTLESQQQGSATWNTVASLTTSSYSLTGLTTNTAYQFRLQTVCTSTQNSSFTSPVSFTTGCQAPTNTFVGSAGATVQSIGWTSPYFYSNGINYLVQHRPKSPANSSWTSVTTTSTNLSLRDLTFSTAYEFQVQTVCPGPVSSSFTSPPRSFTTTACLNTVFASLLSRTNTFNSANLYWGITSYDVFNLNYRPQGGQWSTISSLTTGSYSLTGLAENTVYEWGLSNYCSPTTSSSITMGPSFTTICQNTLNGLSAGDITSTSVRLTYFGSGGAYDVRYRPVNTPNWITSTSITSTNLSLTGLTPNTTYEWQVAVRCSATASSTFTPSLTFVAECRLPTNLSSSGITFNSAQLIWSGTTGITYELDYRPANTTNWTTVTVSGSSYSYYTLTGLATGPYEWRVRSNCGSGIYSAYSSTQSFTTVCQAPAPLSVDYLSSYAASLRWTNIGAGATYNLQWRAGTSVSWNTIPNVARSEYVLTGLSAGSTYQVQVQGVCGTQTSASFTAPQTFTANCPLPSGLRSSVNRQQGSLGWTNVVGVSYEVQWRLRGATAWNTSPVVNELYSNLAGGYGTGPLSPGVYDWQIRSLCADGLATAYTAGPSFTVTVACDASAPTSFNSYPDFTQVSLSWYSFASFSNDFSYEIRWRQAGNTDWNTATSSGNTSIGLAGLTGNTVYEWQVGTRCPTSTTAIFGPLQTFTTTCGQASNANTGCVAYNGAQLSWSGPYNATYELNWRNPNDPNWNNLTGITTTSYNLTGLTNNTAYEWRVRLVCSPTVSIAFTAPRSFTTSCPANTLQIRNITCNSIGIQVSGCNLSSVRWRVLGSNGNWITYPQDPSYGGGTYYNFTPSTAYEAQIQTDCGSSAVANYSDSYTFTTPACTTVPAVCGSLSLRSGFQYDISNQQDITNQSALLAWDPRSAFFGPFVFQWRQGATGAWNTVQPVTTPFYQLTGLASNTLYEWRASFACSTPDFTPISFFRTLCNIPFYPAADNITATQARLLWNGFGSGTTYEVQYRTGTGGWTTVSMATEEYVLTGLQNNTTYEWQIRTLCSGGGTSAWSHSVFFTTTCPVVTNLITNFISTSSATFQWVVPNDTGPTYALQYRPVGTSVWTTINSGIASVGTIRAVALRNLTEQTTYEWQVLTDCGNGNTSAAPNQPLTFRTLSAAPPPSVDQTINFAEITDKYIDETVLLTATTTSSLPVSFSISTQPVSGVALLSGNTITFPGAVGQVTVTAYQPGNASFKPAQLQRTFTVSKRNQSITFNAIPAKKVGDAPFSLTATATSGLLVSFSVVSGPATLNGNTLTLTGPGTVVVEAPAVRQSFMVGLPALAITNLPASSSEGQTVTFNVATNIAPTSPLTVFLQSSNPTRFPVPASVTIAAGTLSTNVSVTLVQDNIPEIDLAVTITAGASNHNQAAGTILVKDDDLPNLELVILPTNISESAGANATRAVLRRTSSSSIAFTANLAASLPNTLLLPGTISLAEGENEKAFTIGVVDNSLLDGQRVVTVTASLLGSCQHSGEMFHGVVLYG
jgi:trimeric autotransporter adhesin